MNYPSYRGYSRGYGGISVADYTRLIRQIPLMVFSVGPHTIRLPEFGDVGSVEDAQGLIDIFTMHAAEKGWIISTTQVKETARGEFYGQVSFQVPEGAGPPREEVWWEEPKEEKTSPWLIGLGIVGGVAVVGGLIYWGTR